MAMLESKLSSSGCGCQSEEEHYSGYCSPQCDCLSQESHDHGACQ